MPFLIAKESRCIPLNTQTCSVTESGPTLRDPMDRSPPDFSVHGIVLVRYGSGPGIEPSSPTLQAEPPGKSQTHTHTETHTLVNVPVGNVPEHPCREQGFCLEALLCPN